MKNSKQYISIAKKEFGILEICIHEKATVFPSLDKLIEDVASFRNWDKFDISIFRAICNLYKEKKRNGFPKYQHALLQCQSPLDNGSKRAQFEFSYLELWQHATGDFTTMRISREQRDKMQASINKITFTDIEICYDLSIPEFRKQMKSYASNIEDCKSIIITGHLIQAEWFNIFTETDGEIGFAQVLTEGLPFVDYYETIHAVFESANSL